MTKRCITSSLQDAPLKSHQGWSFMRSYIALALHSVPPKTCLPRSISLHYQPPLLLRLPHHPHLGRPQYPPIQHIPRLDYFADHPRLPTGNLEHGLVPIMVELLALWGKLLKAIAFEG